VAVPCLPQKAEEGQRAGSLLLPQQLLHSAACRELSRKMRVNHLVNSRQHHKSSGHTNLVATLDVQQIYLPSCQGLGEKWSVKSFWLIGRCSSNGDNAA